ncbi:MAG: chromosome segregation protein SMC, partial [Clostridia bacterium]|nr:chromosome segregation protein SMC [Clostridia bacterium]
EENITLYHNALNELKLREKTLTSEVKESSDSEKELSKQREAAEADQEEKRRRNAELKEERDKYSARYGEAQVQITALNGGIEADRQNIARLQTEKTELQATIETETVNQTTYEEELARWQSEAAEQELTDEEKEKVAALRAEIDGAGEEKKKVNARQEELEAAQNKAQEQITATASRHAKCEVEISRIDTNLENMRQRIWEAYDMSYEDCLPLREADYDIANSANEIANLKRKITNLGPVNANAIEDYEALKVRFDEMITQRDDVEKAIADSTALLDEIKRDMRERFDAGFNTINSNFQQIFKELFGGGRAELQMDYTDCEDPLDAGVEINACPPGKKLTKLTLLSGGEQALTAIAILFAIIKSNPMPFCILDEIEAALDDANVDRFARYLKKFSKETQFIVITHRKPTMNQAENLFGVTMEEKGVSKIVSVKLSEVETRLGGDTVQ